MRTGEEPEQSRGTSRRRSIAQDQAAGRKGWQVKKDMQAARARMLAEEADQTFEGVVRHWLREAADHYFEAGGEDRCTEEMLAGLRVLPVAIRMEAMGMEPKTVFQVNAAPPEPATESRIYTSWIEPGADGT